MVKPLFDTCIIIDYLNGIVAARDELQRYEDRAISSITWIEVMVGVKEDVEEPTRRFLSTFLVLPLDHAVAKESVRTRRSRSIRLPDAIIWATARVSARLLITRDRKAFPADDPGVRIPYELTAPQK